MCTTENRRLYAMDVRFSAGSAYCAQSREPHAARYVIIGLSGDSHTSTTVRAGAKTGSSRVPNEALHHTERFPRCRAGALLVVVALLAWWSAGPAPTLAWQTSQPSHQPIDPGPDQSRLKRIMAADDVAVQRSAALTPTLDGFSLLGEGHRLATLNTWRLTLVDSPDVEMIRPHAEAVATQLAAETGMDFLVSPGTTPYSEGMLPHLGEILVRVATDHFGSPTCGVSPGTWLACGGVDWAIPVYPQGLSWAGGIMTIQPLILSWPEETVRHVVEHEAGHTVGLGHFSEVFDGMLQVMHPIQIVSPQYKSGDRNGLTYESTIVDLDEIILYDSATGKIDEMIQGGPGWASYVSWTRYGDPFKVLLPAVDSEIDPGFDVVWSGFLGGEFDNDLLLYDAESGRFEFRSVDYNGGFPLIRNVGGTRGWTAVVPGDFDADGTVDLLFYRSADGLIVFYTVTQTGRFVPMTEVMFGSRGWTHVVAGDYDGDDRDDLLWYRSTDGVMRFYSVTDAGRFFPTSDILVGTRNWTHIPSGDYDADGSDDLFYYRSADGIARFYTLGDGTFVPMSPVLEATSGWRQIESGTLDGVPGEDLAWYREGHLAATRFNSGSFADIAELKDIALSAEGKITVGDFR